MGVSYIIYSNFQAKGIVLSILSYKISLYLVYAKYLFGDHSHQANFGSHDSPLPFILC